MSLLIGNGVNRISNSVSWETLLRSLWVARPDRLELAYLNNKPFGLLYEEIVLSGVTPEQIFNETATKHRIAGQMRLLTPNDFHRRIMTCGVQHVLTTNYDYSLENSSGMNFEKDNLKRENKYSIFRRRTFRETCIWHVHGECDVPQTITLGYDQYCGYVQKLRMYATAERNGQHGSPFKRGIVDFDRSDDVHSWLDVFLRDDIHIIGLSLDFTEIDLWWALTYKARLSARGWKTGKTYFHDWYEKQHEEPTLAKLSLLTALGVQVRSIHCLEGYEAQYDSFIRTELRN